MTDRSYHIKRRTLLDSNTTFWNSLRVTFLCTGSNAHAQTHPHARTHAQGSVSRTQYAQWHLSVNRFKSVDPSLKKSRLGVVGLTQTRTTWSKSPQKAYECIQTRTQTYTRVRILSQLHETKIHIIQIVKDAVWISVPPARLCYIDTKRVIWHIWISMPPERPTHADHDIILQTQHVLSVSTEKEIPARFHLVYLKECEA